MDIVENHRIKLLNAKCEVVCQAEYLMKKLQNGDDIECCTKKLFAAIKLINRLDCYCFPSFVNTPSINSEFSTGLTELQFYLLTLEIPGLVIELNVNGNIYTIITDGESQSFDMIESELKQLGFFVSYSMPDDSISYTLTCDVTHFGFSIKYELEETENYIFTNTILGSCPSTTTTICNNCTTDADLSKYYQVLDNLLK